MFTVLVDSAQQTRALGRALAARVRGGDLLMLSGDLGSGKTTLTQGLGEGMGVRGRVSSPTFIIARVHPNEDGPDLVHVDAYRIGDLDDLETLDLDTSLPDSVVVVEWGEGKTEGLSDNRLEVTLELLDAGVAAPTGVGDFGDEGGADLSGIDAGKRRVVFNPVGPRWQEDAELEAALVRAVEEEK
ncbi:MAG: tRNA (adenosine(37)-N6)-threonylcarbamoyltransferase complex ATPase subunit type 1 TsaE [Actinomycetaceae bacterium]|nr:tRNA (adenosine(37)-N6)-threonylcarbamoyltransferase complex ATPase subunit type 1 TsaE [Actinomycetaceae bacterium]